MKLTQIEREDLLSYIEFAMSSQYQMGLITPLISRVSEVTQYRSWSPYHGQPISTAIICQMENDFRNILDVWVSETVSRYPKLTHILENRNLFWIKVQVNDTDSCQIDVICSPAIINMYHGVSDYNVFNWSEWTDDMLVNFYKELGGRDYGW